MKIKKAKILLFFILFLIGVTHYSSIVVKANKGTKMGIQVIEKGEDTSGPAEDEKKQELVTEQQGQQNSTQNGKQPDTQDSTIEISYIILAIILSLAFIGYYIRSRRSRYDK